MGEFPRKSEKAERLRIEFRPEGGGADWLFHVKERAISLAVDVSEVLTFDLEGRPYAAFVEGKNYRRGLDGRVLEKFSEGEEKEERRRRFLGDEEREAFLARVRRRVERLAGGGLRFEGGVTTDEVAGFRRWVEKLGEWDATRLAEDEARFHRIYQTVSILPPDQYMALVVQTSQGCPWNRCTFCDLYRDRPYRVKSAGELAAHLEGIKEFLGEGIRLRRSVFLGDANTLAVPLEKLLEMLDQVREGLRGTGGPEGRFYGFTDVFGTRRHAVEDLRRLRDEGMQRLYVGLETGSDALLRLLDKPGNAAEAIEGVRKIRGAGIGVGVIVLLGLGGQTRAAEHEGETIRVLNAMEMGRGDVIYFSPLIEHVHGEHARQVEKMGFERMDTTAMRVQRERIEGALHFGKGKPFTSIYDIRDFIY